MPHSFLHVYSRLTRGSDATLLGVLCEDVTIDAEIGGKIYSSSSNNLIFSLNTFNSRKASLHLYIEVPQETEIYADNIAEIRELMIDYTGQNILVDGQQFSDAAILRVLKRILREYNDTPPVRTKYTLKNHPHIDTINVGTLAQLLRELSISDARNQLNYGAAGMQVGVRDKWNIFANLSASLHQEYEQRKMNEKNWLNIESFRGSVGFL